MGLFFYIDVFFDCWYSSFKWFLVENIYIVWFNKFKSINCAISLIMISAISVFYYIRVIKVVFFESKEAKARNDQFQTIFTVNLFDFDCLVISICLFCLVYFFFYPSTLLLLCQYIVLSSFWF